MRKLLVPIVLALALWLPEVFAAQQGAVAPPPKIGTILFVGSSIFHRWTALAAQMAPLPVVNQGIDGLQTADVRRMLDSEVLPIRPRVIVYYCGSNDVDTGEPAAPIFDRIRQFIDRVATARPGTRLVFVSIIRAPEKRERWDVVDAVNHRVDAYTTATRRLQYVDVNPVLFNRDGTPRMELYLSDQLHFRPAGYDELARILKPVLTTAFNAP